MKKLIEKTTLATVLLFGMVMNGFAQNVVKNDDEDELVPRNLILPYAFYTQTLDLAVGVGGGASGFLQPQAKLFATGFYTTNDSKALVLGLFDYQLPFAKRVFVEFQGSYATYTDQRVYSGFNPEYPGEHAGSNESSPGNYIRGSGNDHWYDLKFRYLLPIGHGKNTLISTSSLRSGLLVDGRTGGDAWNPLKSGRTNFELSLFDRHRTIVNESGENVGDSNGTVVSLEYDNRDFLSNPVKGSFQKITFKDDFGINSSGDWSVVQLDVRKYFDLGRTKTFRQNILALQYWTSVTPSWKVKTDGVDLTIDGQPPNELGSSLGGFYRLKAYEVNRYSDKAAVYYSAELRLIPRWNPFRGMTLLKPLDLDWWMFVPFVEVGRVAPQWSLTKLHEDMRKVLGIGLRFMAQKTVFRLDTAASSDTWSMYAMVGHPF